METLLFISQYILQHECFLLTERSLSSLPGRIQWRRAPYRTDHPAPTLDHPNSIKN